ncbi:MAG TPA: glycosyltransferase [Pseudonocardiaceae bacterium]|jgi:galactofuranosylgalactofuranosylrhamnosyl-N-acetylglucosaminyl-diphospho-decaprenol beta-1,5/1,6-galactofuranosyltransferase|nr:glycosyltransferase [Pseudonocardiaceae bacterium]
MPSTLLQRLILPGKADPLAVRALYVDEQPATARRVWPPTGATTAPDPRDVDLEVTLANPNARRVRALSRTSVRVPEQTEVSFAAYFNAFPASYWRRWSTLRTVHLRLDVEGEGRVEVYRSKADATPIHVHGELIESAAGRCRVDIELDLTPFEDGGWYWFDVSTDDAELVVHSGGWHAPVEAPGRAAVTIGMPTFNRPTDCVATLRAIGSDELVRSMVTAVVIPDQGANKVRDQEGFAAAQAALGDRLRIIDQPNLGGSGGYARVMYEALEHTDCEQVLFMDDDIVLEPDSILRAVAFSRFAHQPMLVGGQMLQAQARSRLHAWGEILDRHRMQWGKAPGTEYDHDFTQQSLRQTAWMHRRTDVDYNAWWCCLIPRTVAEHIGLPLPLFIKWDDVEYGVRARAAGYPTATVPGVAVWHMSFADKDDTTDWQAYFHLRNRLVGAALHSEEQRPTAVLAASLKNALKHALAMQYSTLALQEMAIRDFLAGPEALFEKLPTALGEVRARLAEFTDGQVLDSRELPLPAGGQVAVEHLLTPPTNPVTIGATLLKRLAHQLRPVDPQAHRRPQLSLARDDARWFVLSGMDGVTVSTADGRGVTYRKRDPQAFRTMLARSVALHRTLAREFPRMRQRYRAAAEALTSRPGWKRVFDA